MSSRPDLYLITMHLVRFGVNTASRLGTSLIELLVVLRARVHIHEFVDDVFPHQPQLGSRPGDTIEL
jgi:hypothetical protein